MNHISNSEAAWIAFAALPPVVLYLLFSAHQTRQRMAARKTLIDKFTSAEDFAAFLQSPAGQKFVTDLSGSEGPARALIGAIQKGIILVSLGAGVRWEGVTVERMAEVATIGVLLMCVGTGILISAWISYRMSMSLGLIDKPAGDNRQNLSEK